MRPHHQRRAPARVVLLFGVGAVAMSGIRCDYDEYPLEPTFCDRWCRVLSRSGCDQEPENCVRNCERSRGPAECAARHESLLACYESTPSSSFVCSGQGFQEIARPEESVCPAERDALIECAYPEVEQCLNLCRAFDAAYRSDAGDAGGEDDTDAGGGKICPSYDIPCDSMCWLVPAIAANFDDGSALDGGAALDAAAALFSCGIARAEACREPTPEGEPVVSANWVTVLSDCVDDLF